MMTIFLKDIWQIENTRDYKVHFARWNKQSQPLDVFIEGESEWQKWQEYRPRNDMFNRRFIFSLMDFYHEPEIWLFGGVFEVLERPATGYDVKLSDQGRNFIGRLKLWSPYTSRNVRVNMEPHYSEFEVSEILIKRFSG